MLTPRNSRGRTSGVKDSLFSLLCNVKAISNPKHTVSIDNCVYPENRVVQGGERAGVWGCCLGFRQRLRFRVQGSSNPPVLHSEYLNCIQCRFWVLRARGFYGLVVRV